MFADRVDRPFVSERDVKGARFDATGFGMRLWSTRWYSWVVMSDLASQADWLKRLGGFALLGKGPTPWAATLDDDIAILRNMAVNERAPAMDEIVTEADEFISKFLHMVSATATTHPATSRMLIVADALTALIAMHYKAHFNRPRPTQVVPGFMSPIQHGGHASFPSGHATQAHVFATLLSKVMPQALGFSDPIPGFAGRTTIDKTLGALADRISRNREIAGLHYPSDTKAGVKLAAAIIDKILLDREYLPKFTKLVDNAKAEWENTGVFDDGKDADISAGEKNVRD
ncbi:phosphatase PAP2 family protein [Bradyrhizobium huanghuaihaiense]|uniref:phosphatase PAP2 family protein n=1 Tax=Bradyrhizobium huanghuaihaiense TaxID=990078 RepID=UPI0021AAEA77|nr:phosphatase PAP2 family protein [Bradyrhizobium sp. CB3035]UWU73665.1 phosphatase PAP2 family protein [Bradyrhizobium sp. CB3035]